MRHSLVGAILAVLGVFAFSIMMLAQNAQQAGSAKAQAGKGTPDLTGIWSNPKQGDTMSVLLPAPEPMPLTKWAEEQYNYNHDFGPTVGGQRGRNELDPNAHCFPPGPARLVLSTGPGFG